MKTKSNGNKNQPDFKKTKLKVGKTIKRSNVTKFSLTSKRINVPVQNTITAKDITTHKEVLDKISRKLNHFSSNVKIAAFDECSSFFRTAKDPGNHIPLILPSVLEILYDEDKESRNALLNFMNLLIKLCETSSFQAITPTLVTYICSGLTSLHKGVRRDTLILLQSLCENHSSIFGSYCEKICGYLLTLLADTSFNTGPSSFLTMMTGVKLSENKKTSSTSSKLKYNRAKEKQDNKKNSQKSSNSLHVILNILSLLLTSNLTETIGISGSSKKSAFSTSVLSSNLNNWRQHTSYKQQSDHVVPYLWRKDIASAYDSCIVLSSICRTSNAFESSQINSLSDNNVSRSMSLTSLELILARLCLTWDSLITSESLLPSAPTHSTGHGHGAITTSGMSTITILQEILQVVVKIHQIFYIHGYYDQNQILQLNTDHSKLGDNHNSMFKFLTLAIKYFPYQSQDVLLALPGSMNELYSKKIIDDLNGSLAEFALLYKFSVSNKSSESNEDLNGYLHSNEVNDYSLNSEFICDAKTARIESEMTELSSQYIYMRLDTLLDFIKHVSFSCNKDIQKNIVDRIDYEVDEMILAKLSYFDDDSLQKLYNGLGIMALSSSVTSQHEENNAAAIRKDDTSTAFNNIRDILMYSLTIVENIPQLRQGAIFQDSSINNNIGEDLDNEIVNSVEYTPAIDNSDAALNDNNRIDISVAVDESSSLTERGLQENNELAVSNTVDMTGNHGETDFMELGILQEPILADSEVPKAKNKDNKKSFHRLYNWLKYVIKLNVVSFCGIISNDHLWQPFQYTSQQPLRVYINYCQQLISVFQHIFPLLSISSWLISSNLQLNIMQAVVYLLQRIQINIENDVSSTEIKLYSDLSILCKQIMMCYLPKLQDDFVTVTGNESDNFIHNSLCLPFPSPVLLEESKLFCLIEVYYYSIFEVQEDLFYATIQLISSISVISVRKQLVYHQFFQALMSKKDCNVYPKLSRRDIVAVLFYGLRAHLHYHFHDLNPNESRLSEYDNQLQVLPQFVSVICHCLRDCIDNDTYLHANSSIYSLILTNISRIMEDLNRSEDFIMSLATVSSLAVILNILLQSVLCSMSQFSQVVDDNSPNNNEGGPRQFAEALIDFVCNVGLWIVTHSTVDIKLKDGLLGESTESVQLRFNDKNDSLYISKYFTSLFSSLAFSTEGSTFNNDLTLTNTAQESFPVYSKFLDKFIITVTSVMRPDNNMVTSSEAEIDKIDIKSQVLNYLRGFKTLIDYPSVIFLQTIFDDKINELLLRVTEGYKSINEKDSEIERYFSLMMKNKFSN